MGNLLNIINSFFQKPTFTTYGSARWATKKDIASMLSDIDKLPKEGAFILGQPMKLENKRLDLPLEIALKHILVLGPSGSGKSRCFFLHQLRHYQGSYITTDPKSEAWTLTSGKRKRPIRYAPTDPDNSDPFNWIPLCGIDPTLCMQLAGAIITSKSEGDNKFYIEAGTAFLASLFAHASTFETPTPAACYDFLTGVDGELLTQFLLRSPNQYARKFASSFTKAEPKLQGNIIIGVGNLLNWLADEKVRRFTSSTLLPPCLGKLRHQRTSVYWCLDEKDVEVLKPLSTLFYTLALHQIKSENQGNLPIALFLDECANVGRIPGLEVAIAILRGRNIGLVLGLQSVAQLENVYGKSAAKVIIDNCGTVIVLAGLKLESGKYVSDTLGNTTITEERISYTKKGFWSASTQTRSLEKIRRPLASSDEIRIMEKTEQIIISDNYRPILCKRFWYSLPPSTAKSTKLGNVLTINIEFSDSAQSENSKKSEKPSQFKPVPKAKK